MPVHRKSNAIMKSFYGDTVTTENCSCTSYYYTSESDCLSIRRLIEQRSRINRLFRESYLPPKDIQLLDKLIRTRAAYDDIRKQLLSGSNVNIKERAILKPIKLTSAMGKELKQAEKNSDIFGMIDLVDKGIPCGHKQLSQCCSCYSCGSKARFHMQAPKSRRRKFPYTSGFNNTISSDASNKTITKGVHFKTKNIKSEPCTCMTKSYDSVKRRSRNFGQLPFLGYFPINEYAHHTISAPFSKSKLLCLTKPAELPVKLLPQHKSCRKNSRILEHKKAVYTLDKDKSCINKPIYTDVSESLMLKNIAKEYSMHIKKLSATMKSTPNTSTNLTNKSSLRNAVNNHYPTTPTKRYLRREFEKKIVHNAANKYISDMTQNTENIQTVIRTQISNNKLQITTGPAAYRSSSNKKEIDGTNTPRNSDIIVTLKNNSESTGRKHINNNEILINSARKRLLCGPKNKPNQYKPKTNKYTFPHNIISSKLLYTRTASTPNISLLYAGPSTRLFTNASKDSLDIKNRRDYSIVQEDKINKFVQKPLQNSPSINFYPCNLKINNKNSHYYKFIHSSKDQLVVNNRNKVHRGSRKEILTPRQIPSETVKLGRKIRKHKMRKCLYKLKLVNTKKEKPIPKCTVSKGLHNNKNRSDRLSYLCSSSSDCKKESHIKVLHRYKYQLCNNKGVKNYFNSRPISPLEVSKVQSSSLLHKSDIPFKYLRTKSLCSLLHNDVSDKLSSSFDCKHLNKPNILDHNKTFEQHNASNIHVENKSITDMVQKDKQQRKLQFLKIEKKAKCFMLGTTIKRCICNSKLHKTRRNKINHSIVNFYAENKEIDIYKYSDVECCIKKDSLNTLRALNETTVFTATSQHPTKHKNISLQYLQNNHQNNFNKLYKNRHEHALSTTVTYSNYNAIVPKIFLPSINQSINLSSRRIVRFKSQFNFEFDYLKNTNLSKDKNSRFCRALVEGLNKKSSVFWKKYLHDAKTDKSPSKHTGIGQFLRRSYCTMNLQIANRGQIHRNKLKPYECEPGICEPSKCDPIECQKRIMKRLMKQSSTMSENKTLISSSSSTAGIGMRNKIHQYSAVPDSIEKNPYITHPSRRETLKASGQQVVRVGSTFNFDIELFKDLTPRAPIKKEHRPSMYSKSSGNGSRKSRTQETKGMTVQKHNIESQSAKMRDRSSSVLPITKKCFCTLKLQKRGRLNPHIKNVSHGTSTPMKIKIEPVAIEASQNTKPLKFLPYECEPGICMPGECDPYACLELINKRFKNKGTYSTRSNITSSSSMTGKRRLQTKGKQVQSRKNHPKPVRSTAAVVSKPNPDKTRTSRQAVRIGSTISFNIEFYKDRFPSSEHIETAAKTVNIARHKNHDIKSHFVTKDKGVEGKAIALHSRDSQAVPKKQDRGLGVGPILKRCFCTLKLHKPKETSKLEIKRKVIVASQSTATPVLKEVPDFYTRSTMKKESKPQVHKLLPYECEPGVCVPGSCDPYDCEKHIKRRLRNRGSGTRHRKPRSVSSSVRRGKFRDSHVQFAGKEKIYKATDIAVRNIEPKQSFETIISQPSRQAVRIGSTLSFDIEFYKNSGITGGLPPQTPISQIPRKVESSVTNKYPTSMNRTMQRTTAMRDTESQVIAKKMHSTMTGVKPFLKRCFCTLQLQKRENIKKPVEHKIVSTKTHKPKIEAVEKGTRTKVYPIQYNTKLETYECEPGTCIPGECDPYECLKQIKRRELKNKLTGTAKPKGRSVSSLISGSPKYRARKVQAFTDAQNMREISQSPHAATEHKQRQRLTYSNSPPRQAVRIGSCFSFNVEFYKDSSPQAPFTPICPPECKPVCHKGCKKSYKITETQQKNTRTLSTYSRGSNMRHIKAQSNDLKMKSKGSGMKPALKRCFCTLKLQKIGNQQHDIKKKSVDFAPKHIDTFTSTAKKAEIVGTAKEVGTKTKRERFTYNLEPYECEPGFCIPGQCDLHQCLKRIKQRKMKNLSTETKGPQKKTVSSFTYQNKILKSTKTQNHMNKPQPLPQETKPVQQVFEKPPRPCPAVENIKRQAVRIGSNFSFNIDFFKDGNGLSCPTSPYLSVKPEKSKSTSSIYTSNAIKTKDKGFHYDKFGHHKKSQVASIKTESRGSGAGPLLKRCFCTLTLQKAPTHERHKEQSNPVKVQKTLLNTENKTTSTKEKYILPEKQMHLDPYECEPGVCIPGKCDPYECLERIKKRGTSRKSQTDKCKYNCKGLQHNVKALKANKQNETLSVSVNKTTAGPPKESIIVEQPRFPKLLDANKQAVKISSNFSFNIEFHKDIAHQKAPQLSIRPATQNLCKAKQTESSQKVTKCEKQCGHCDNSRSCRSQSDSPKTENKSSGVGKLLKRCFCTAKLNKQLNPPHNRGAFTVGRVDTIKPTFPFTHQNYWVQYHTQQSLITKKKGKIDNDNLKQTISCNHCQDHKTKSKSKDSGDMKTILPYSPSKFKRRISKSVIQSDNNSDEGCTPKTCPDQGMMPNTKKANLKGAKRLTVKKSKSAIAGKKSGSSIQKSTIKDFVCRCMQLFTKSKNKTNIFTKCSPVCKNVQADFLNTSNSGRHSNAVNINTTTKNSKSLKITSTNKNVIDKETKFTKYQSGDNGQINNVKKVACPRCKTQGNQVNKIKQKKTSNKVRFSFTSENVNKSGNVFKSMGKNPSKLNNANITCIAMCPCCGGFKINKVNPTPKTSVKNNKSCRCVGKCLCPKLKSAMKTTSKCVCGNRECSKEAKKLKRKLPKQVKSKKNEPCVCGSTICDSIKEESKRHIDHSCECASALEHSQKKANKKELAKKKKLLRKKEQDLASKKQKENLEKEEQLLAKKKYKAFLERQKRYKKEDEARKKKRMREDKRMLQEVDKYKNAGDCSLITESVLDVAKLGFVSAGDILRCAGKAAIDPKFTYDNIKTTVTEPGRAWSKLKSAADDSPGIATLKRLKLRLKETSCVKSGKQTLEAHPLTYYCVHMADKDPKKRMQNKSKQQKIDFKCSPYMLSLRKRPHLCIYLCCPWFYPHCISILNLWKQFTDIILFLLAVAVWSPCIFCMEACRALMCCFLCTG